jgi:hypothetical protein
MLNCDVEDGTCEVAASVADCDLETICNGITFAYNRDDDGTSMANPPTIDREVGSNCPASAPFDPGAGRSEWFGFRFFQGRIQMRTGTKACGPEPDPDDWADITDDQIVALGGFRLVDECVGIIDEVGPGGAAPDGDVFEDTDEDGELTCQDLCEAGTLDEGDFVVTAPRVLIELSGRSARIESAQPPFQMSQVVDLPNFGIRPVPWGGICR